MGSVGDLGMCALFFSITLIIILTMLAVVFSDPHTKAIQTETFGIMLIQCSSIFATLRPPSTLQIVNDTINLSQSKILYHILCYIHINLLYRQVRGVLTKDKEMYKSANKLSNPPLRRHVASNPFQDYVDGVAELPVDELKNIDLLSSSFNQSSASKGKAPAAKRSKYA